MFDNYKVGARLPTDLRVPMSSDMAYFWNMGRQVNELARESPAFSKNVLKGANFVTKRKVPSWTGYYEVGAGPLTTNPKIKLTDLIITAKKNSITTNGFYADDKGILIPDVNGHAVPRTSVGTILFYTNLLLKWANVLTYDPMRKRSETLRRRIRRVTDSRDWADKYFKPFADKASHTARSEKEIGLLANKTFVPVEEAPYVVPEFWAASLDLAIQIGGAISLPHPAVELTREIISRAKVVATEITKPPIEVLKAILKYLKWVLIGAAAGLGIFLIAQVTQAVKT